MKREGREKTLREALADKVLAMIEAGPEGDPAAFDEMALEIFAYQYACNQPYRRFCDAKGVTPENITHWSEIPALPTEAFKKEMIASFPMEEAVMALLTSGTTSPNQRGRIFRDETGRKLVLTANRVMTGAYLFPDFASGQRCRLLILAPGPDLAPSMGMAVGMEQTRLHFGTPESRFLLGRTGIDVRGLVAALREAEETGEPVALIGATSAFVYFFRACQKKGLTFRLPPGSRICDGGGYRGRFGEMTREDYYALAEEIFGVPATHCVNTLGMGESATNYFDNSLREFFLGRSGVPRRKVPPPWTRVAAVSVEDLTPFPPGRVGLLRHYDLANLPTAVAVQTDNLGYTDESNP
ncbi:MAG: acyl-protein synthetase [Bacillota bacterium]|nr:acyl-protein synthetase [Bacillota bacterium]